MSRPAGRAQPIPLRQSETFFHSAAFPIHYIEILQPTSPAHPRGPALRISYLSGVNVTRNGRNLLLSALFGIGAIVSASAQNTAYSPQLFSQMRWRQIGPMRAGRTRALAGVASQPATFYIGGVNGGVWKTTDGGATWNSLWDAQPSGSIGAIAVADSDPNIVYVGSGEGLQRPDLSTGDGVYKSTDAGKTWIH